MGVGLALSTFHKVPSHKRVILPLVCPTGPIQNLESRSWGGFQSVMSCLSIKSQILSKIGEMDTCASILCNGWPIQTQMLPHGSLYERRVTFPLVIHTDTHIHTHTSTPCSVIPVRALNYLCHYHGECCRASRCSEYIWLHYPTTHGVAPRRWCAPTGLPHIWFHQMKVSDPPVRMDPAMCVHHQNNWHINSITI